MYIVAVCLLVQFMGRKTLFFLLHNDEFVYFDILIVLDFSANRFLCAFICTKEEKCRCSLKVLEYECIHPYKYSGLVICPGKSK